MKKKEGVFNLGNTSLQKRRKDPKRARQGLAGAFDGAPGAEAGGAGGTRWGLPETHTDWPCLPLSSVWLFQSVLSRGLPRDALSRADESKASIPRPSYLEGVVGSDRARPLSVVTSGRHMLPGLMRLCAFPPGRSEMQVEYRQEDWIGVSLPAGRGHPLSSLVPGPLSPPQQLFGAL